MAIHDSQSGALALRIGVAQGIMVDGPIPILLIFRNDGKKNIRLLNKFSAHPATVYAFTLKGPTGPAWTYLLGGIAQLTHPFSYIELAPGGEFEHRVSLNDVLERPLVAGDYELSAAYRNSSGEDCFKGLVESEPVAIRVNMLGSR